MGGVTLPGLSPRSSRSAGDIAVKVSRLTNLVRKGYLGGNIYPRTKCFFHSQPACNRTPSFFSSNPQQEKKPIRSNTKKLQDQRHHHVAAAQLGRYGRLLEARHLLDDATHCGPSQGQILPWKRLAPVYSAEDGSMHLPWGKPGFVRSWKLREFPNASYFWPTSFGRWRRNAFDWAS